MRLTLVTETYPPDVNGVAMTLEQLTRGMARRGHELTVVRPDPQVDYEATHERITLHHVRGLPIPCYPELRFGFPSGSHLREAWGRDRPDLVHVATEGPLGRSAIRAARKLGVPATTSFHTNFHTYATLYGFGWLQRMTLGWLRKVHDQGATTYVPSETVRKTLEAAKFGNLQVLGRGVDMERFNPGRRDRALRASWGADDDTPVGLYVGRLATEKNITLTVGAFEAMAAVLPGMKCVLIGDGPMRAKLEKEHPEYHFAGMRLGDDLARHIASGDVFPFGSITETFGNVVTEAMASGLLVLAYDYAAARLHIESGENGWKVPLGDEGAFLAAAEQLARDVPAWASMRAGAAETARGLSWEAIVDGFEHRARRVIAAQGGEARLTEAAETA